MADAMNRSTKPPKGFYLTTTVIGLGFFTMGLMDPLYDAYVPLFLRDFIDSFFWVGTIMTVDNVFAVLLIPIVAAWSDAVRTPIGRRMPFILVTLPLSAVFFALIPFGALPLGSLPVLVVFIFMLNIFKQAARGPVVALMPDLTPPEFRSEANGVINMMGGIAAIVGTVGLAQLADVDIQLPIIGSTARRLPFMIAGLLVVIATIAIRALVHEPASPYAGESERRPSVMESLKRVFGSDGDTSARNVLFALFFWFLGYQGMLPFVTTYSVEILGTTEGLAGLSPGAVAVSYALFAIPSGMLAHRIGRRTVIRASLVGIVILMLLVFVHNPITTAIGLGTTAKWISFLVLLFFFGAFWGSVITNSFPMLWQAASYEDMGVYTGSYYLFSQTAAITAPPLAGALIDIVARGLGFATGLRSIFLFSVVCMVVALLFMSRVTREN